MQRVPVKQIEVGQQFDQSLFLSSGQKLLGPGIPITVRHLRAIQRCGDAEVLLAEDLTELVQAGLVTPWSASSLHVGKRSRHGVLTRSGQMLLEPGQEVEQHHLDALREVGDEAYQGAGERGEQGDEPRGDRMLLADALLEALEQQADTLPLRVTPAPDAGWIRPDPASEWPAPDGLSELRDERVEALRTLFARLEAGVNMPLAVFDPILDELMEQLSRHPTRFTQLALLCPRREDYLPDHAYTVCVLAMAVAANMSWPREDVRGVGLASLVADLGMLMVPRRIRSSAAELTEMDRAHIRLHPICTLAMLQPIPGVPPLVQLAAIEHHERENGSGYPRGRRGEAICDYARVLAVADTFAAGTEPRSYRQRKLPYTVMEETLRGASSLALWNEAARGLVRAAGLFPVGSYVKLSDATRAHVIEANPEMVDRPVVQPLSVDGEHAGQPIDLAQLPRQSLAVTRPIADATG